MNLILVNRTLSWKKKFEPIYDQWIYRLAHCAKCTALIIVDSSTSFRCRPFPGLLTMNGLGEAWKMVRIFPGKSCPAGTQLVELRFSAGLLFKERTTEPDRGGSLFCIFLVLPLLVNELLMNLRTFQHVRAEGNLSARGRKQQIVWKNLQLLGCCFFLGANVVKFMGFIYPH